MKQKSFFDLSLKKYNNFYISHQNINVHNFLCGLVLAFTFESTLASFAFEGVTALIALAGVCIGLAMDYCGRKQIVAGDSNNPSVVYQEQGFGSNKTIEQLAEEERQEWQQKAALYYQEHVFHHIENSEVQNYETNRESEIINVEKEKINDDEKLIKSTYQNINVENNTITVLSENGSVSIDVENICDAISESIDNSENYVVIHDSDHNNFVYKKCSDLNVHECAYNFAQTIPFSEPTKNAFIDGMHAMCKGAAHGLINSIKDMATHPVETMTNAIVGKYLFACQLGTIVYNAAKIGVTALIDPEKGSKEWKEYTAPVVGLMNHIQAATTSELLEQGAACIVGFVVQNKVFGKLNNVYNAVTNRVLVCASDNFSLQENNIHLNAYNSTIESLDKSQKKLVRQKVLPNNGPPYLEKLSPQAFEEAFNYAITGNNMNHFFGKIEHNLVPLELSCGGRPEVLRIILQSIEGKVPASGVFIDIPLNVQGFKVYVRGRVMNGIPKLSTFFIKTEDLK